MCVPHTSHVVSASLYINIESVRANGVQLSPSPSIGLCQTVCVCLSVRKVYCDKTADWIQMLFGMVSGVGSSAGSFAAIGGQEINDVISTSNHWILINK